MKVAFALRRAVLVLVATATVGGLSPIGVNLSAQESQQRLPTLAQADKKATNKKKSTTPQPAAEAATKAASVDASSFLSADRATVWNPGMMEAGGIPQRTKICADVKPLGNDRDDTAQIQRAIDGCPLGDVVRLSEGRFLINGGNLVLVNKGITLRGAGPGKTILEKADGAKPFRDHTKPERTPVIVVGPGRWRAPDTQMRSFNLTADAVKGETSVKVASTAGLKAGQIVLLDELSGAGWQTDPLGRGKVWASPDWRVVWRKRDPSMGHLDDFTPADFPSTHNSAGMWFSRPDRPTTELKQIASIADQTITFTSPIHISYRTANTAQITAYQIPHTVNAGVEDLTLTGGDSGNLRFNWAAMSWARNVESTVWHGEGIAIDGSFRIEVRDFYIHDAAWAQVGGGGYALSLALGTSEVLIENGIIVKANKLMVARSSGAGSVFGYNYTDMAYINSEPGWIETGLNASHMVGPHHILFEGNYGHNGESDDTHGNSIYHTFYRNHFRGIRGKFENQAGGVIDDANQPSNQPKRCIGLMTTTYWMSFVGNVLGAPGQMKGWIYETDLLTRTPGIWMLGWDGSKPYISDAKVEATTLRHGNFDYLTNSVKWDPATANRSLPNSLYLTKRPAFFDKGRGYAWPWVDPVGETKIHVLPAKVRYEAGTPFVQP